MDKTEGQAFPKRIIIGDYVSSQHDGQTHYINAMNLCRLYGFNPNECVLAESNRPKTLLGLSKDLPRFTVRYYGDYVEEKRRVENP